ncbi:hypothetical protein [Haloterrigena alkaliphila]|uniref:Uncharacterized protein n=1 Tax=Haloterrigena alkaliphila TaxID=2816475 RepID=A0A8A2VI09_9EURY|nr:hypothetical protein [Haloterrigena alkaliphila]QSW97848.1 hypothetical protein J0X25_10490 [Haloterrigena alkaliphila]
MSDSRDGTGVEVGPIELEDVFANLFRDGRTNAVLSWALVAVLVVVFVESVLDADRQWMVFVAAVGAIVLVPPVSAWEWRMMLPWELLVLALLPILTRGLLGGTVGTFATYLSIAAIALIVTVELHMFTWMRVTHWFAIALVVMLTLASVAVWTIVRWTFDRSLGTSYLSTNEVLMVEFLWVTAAGVAAGVLFDVYFRRRDRQLRRAIGRVGRR